MAIYKYLGYGVTNSKGKAKLDHDKNGDPITHSYTGTGAGELDIIASLDNPSDISDSSIQSEIYSLYDVIFKDIGTDTQYTAWAYTTNITVTRDSTETKIAQVNTASIGSQYQGLTTTDFTIKCDIRVEDYYRNMNLFNVRNGTTVIQNVGMNNFGLDDGEYHHILLQCINGTLKVFDNDVEVNTYELTSSGNRIYLQTSSGMTVYYKNFMIY